MTVYTVSEGHTGNLLRPLKIAVFRALAVWSWLLEGYVEDGHQELVSCLFPWHLCPFCSTLKTSQTSQFRKMMHRAWKGLVQSYNHRTKYRISVCCSPGWPPRACSLPWLPWCWDEGWSTVPVRDVLTVCSFLDIHHFCLIILYIIWLKFSNFDLSCSTCTFCKQGHLRS